MTQRTTRAMILCAGLGTRLRPLTDERAKPLVPVGDRAALAHILDRVLAAGAARVVVNTHHRADDLRAFLAETGDARLALSEETTLLGTAGGIRHAAPLLGEGDVLVWNGDILADVDLARLARAHADAGAGARAATLVVAPREGDAGNVGIDDAGEVVRLRRETVRAGETRSADFLGIHWMAAAVRARCDALPGGVGDSVGDVYLPAMREEARIGVFEHARCWWDLGTIGAYLDANLAWLRARGPSSFVGAGARVDPSATLEHAIVGAGARVEGAVTLARTVVWPGARVRDSVADGVVTPSMVVRRSPA